MKDLFLQFCQKYFRRLVETEFYVSERTFRNFFLKNFWCCTVFWLKAEKFQQLNRKWPASLSNYLRCLPGNILRKNTFCWKLCCGIFSVDFWIIFLALLAVKFSRFIRIVCLRVRCTVCRLQFKNSWFFKNYWNWAEILKVFGSEYSPVLSKNQLTCFKEKRREKSLLGNSQAFSNFEHINFLVVGKNWWATLSKLHSICPKNWIEGKKFCQKKCSDSFFFGFWVSFWWSFQKNGNFCRGCQNCINHVQTNILRVYFCNFLKFVFVFGLWDESFWTLA